MGSLALSRVEATDQPAPTIADEVARIARQELAPIAGAIDAGSVYPGELLRSLGKVGAWGSHVPQEGPADLRCAIQSMAVIGEVCGATAFMAWCQNTLVWYAANSTNLKLARRFGDSFSSGRVLGGTGLSNPMKSFFGIERLKLKGRKVEGGYIVKGALPWVSNLGPDHYFGTIFEREDEGGGTAKAGRAAPKAGRTSSCSLPIAPIRRSPCSRASRSSPWTARAPLACSSATCSCRMN